MKQCDYLVIGAGIAGASAAYELAAHGTVTVLEREPTPGYHSTGRSAAVYTQTYGAPVIRALTIASLAFFESPPSPSEGRQLLRPRGELWFGRADQQQKLDAAYASFSKQVKGVRRLGAEEVRALLPVLREGYAAGGVLEPDAMDMDVDAIHQIFLQGLRARGGAVLTDAEVMRLSRKEGRWLADTPGECYAAPVLVNAAGAWCDELALLAGVKPVGLSPFRRTAFVFDPPSGHDASGWPMAVDADEGFYFKPDAGRLLASPADETAVAPCDARPDDLDVATAAERLERATVMEVKRIFRSWAGLRTFAPDRVPVVGMDPAAGGFFWLAGQGGYGIMTAPAMARLTRGLILEGGVPGELRALGVAAGELSPARFAG